MRLNNVLRGNLARLKMDQFGLVIRSALFFSATYY